MDFETLSNSKMKIPGIESFIERHIIQFFLINNNSNKKKLRKLIYSSLFVEKTLSMDFEILSNSKMKIPGIESFIERHMMKSSLRQIIIKLEKLIYFSSPRWENFIGGFGKFIEFENENSRGIIVRDGKIFEVVKCQFRFKLRRRSILSILSGNVRWKRDVQVVALNYLIVEIDW